MFDDDIDKNMYLEDWIMSRCNAWRDHYESNYSEIHDEYYRLWRGIWNKSDTMRESERSRIISPATQQAVESSVAEIEEATFGRGKFFDIKDDLQDPNPQDIAFLRNQLEEDMHFTKARSSIAECLINAAVFGTGIGELVLEEVTELVPQARSGMDNTVQVVGVVNQKRTVVKLHPIMPQNFLIDPLATNIDDALGVAIDKMVAYHEVKQGIDSGIYRNVPVSKFDYESDLKDASDIDISMYESDMVRLTKYYGLVPTYLLDKVSNDEDISVEGSSKDDSDSSYTEVIVVIANGDTLLKVEHNPYMKQDRPVVAFSWDVVPFKFWGRGICEKAYNSQKALDTELRARIDALALTVHPMMAVDASRMPRGAKLDVRAGKTILTNGNPSEVLQPFNFGGLDATSFNQAAALQTMVQQATGAIDSAGIPASINGEGTAAGTSMALGAIIKRHKRTLINFQENFLIPFVEKSACRYMQFSDKLYPVKDYKFVATSSLGIVAREYEVTQLVQLLQTMSPESPMYPLLVESIVDNMGLSNREAIINSMRQARQPDPQQQQLQQLNTQMELEGKKATLDNIQAQTAEIMSRVQQNQVETQLLPVEEETKRIAALAKSMPASDFEQLVEYAKLELKEMEIDTKRDIVKLQMQNQK